MQIQTVNSWEIKGKSSNGRSYQLRRQHVLWRDEGESEKKGLIKRKRWVAKQIRATTIALK